LKNAAAETASFDQEYVADLQRVFCDRVALLDFDI